MDINESEVEKGSVELTRFYGKSTSAIGSIKLAIYAGGENKLIEFVVLDWFSAFNMIMGRSWIQSMRAVPSTYDQCICLPSPNDIKEIKGNQLAVRSCYLSGYKLGHQPDQ